MAAAAINVAWGRREGGRGKRLRRWTAQTSRGRERERRDGGGTEQKRGGEEAVIGDNRGEKIWGE